MRSLFVPRRVLEATPQQIVASGASASSYGLDPVDSDANWRRAGRLGRREVPHWSREKAVTHSVAAYRVNPMARAIIDTYASFCIGDSGVKYECTNPAVSEIVKEFWEDPANACAASQDVDFRSQMLMGEQLYEMMVGPRSGAVRYCPIDPVAISEVLLRKGNPNWIQAVRLGNNEDAGLSGVEERTLTAVSVDDETGLRSGQVMFWRPFRALNTDIRSMPFLAPVLDWLDNYDQILSNLMDRTALGRYMVWDVTVTGGQPEVDAFVKNRLPKGPPTSGGIEVHNESVTWEPKSVTVGADEDSVTAQAAMTMFAGGSGLAKAQPLAAKVLTPGGWRTMGSLQPGDEVLTPKGRPAKILGIYPQGGVEAFDVTFSDGARTQATGDHLWFTQTALDRGHRRPGSVKTTRQVAESLRYNARWNHYVPLIEPVEGADDVLPIDPYVLGALLGDGHMRIKTDGAVEVLMSSADAELIDAVNARVDGEFRHVANYDYRYIEPSRSSVLRQGLRDLGLCGSKSHTKFIPDSYMTASAKTRMALLRGLLDTDGSASEHTSAALTTVSEQLASNIRTLVWSLGGVCTLKAGIGQTYRHKGEVRRGRPTYHVRITLPEGERYFDLERKQARIRPGQKTGRAVRTVRQIESVGEVECQCILIDDPDHLYITDDYIVTHNTWLAEPDGANRATSQSMAEPVRRRVGGIQQIWLAQQTELVRFAVDRAVAAGRLSSMVSSADPRTGAQNEVPAAQTVIVTGPEVAAADATITAQVLLNLSTALSGMVTTGILSPEAAKVAAKKAWEGYVGVPYRAELDSPTANPDDIAQEVDQAQVTESPHLRLAK